MPPCPLPTSSPSTGDSVIARALPEAISSCKNVTLNQSHFLYRGFHIKRVKPSVLFLLIQFFNDSGRIPHCERVGWNVFGYHGTRADYCSVPDGYTGTNGCMSAYPALLANSYRSAVFPFPAILYVHRVFSCVDVDSRCNEGFAAYGYFGSIQNNSSEVDENTIPGIDILPIIAIKRWFQVYVFCRVGT